MIIINDTIGVVGRTREYGKKSSCHLLQKDTLPSVLCPCLFPSSSPHSHSTWMPHDSFPALSFLQVFFIRKVVLTQCPGLLQLSGGIVQQPNVCNLCSFSVTGSWREIGQKNTIVRSELHSLLDSLFNILGGRFRITLLV